MNSSDSSTHPSKLDSSTLPTWEALFEDDTENEGEISCSNEVAGQGMNNLPVYSHNDSNYISNVVVDELEEMEQRQRRGIHECGNDQPQHIREHNYARQPLRERNASGCGGNQSQEHFSAEEGDDDEYDDQDYYPNRWYFNYMFSFFSLLTHARARDSSAAAAAAARSASPDSPRSGTRG